MTKMEGLVKCSANCVPLSPISFLERAAFVYGDKASIIYGNTRYSWRETHGRCLLLASALSQMGLNRGDVACDNEVEIPCFWLCGKVAALAPNIPALYELFFGVPMAGAVLSALNTRLDAPMLALLLQQLEAKIICVDSQYVQIFLKALELISAAKAKSPFLVVIRDSNQGAFSTTQEVPPCSLDYDRLLEMGKHDFEIVSPIDECDPITVNYTSGSTGTPKGAVYSHRATYLNSIAQIFRFEMSAKTVFLWTVDMFRCSGWCFTWAMAALGGTNICLRNVTAKVIFDSIFIHKVTHLCGAPTILNIIAEASFAGHRPLATKVDLVIAGVLPPLEILNNVHKLGFNVYHAYGMTEALGLVTVRSLDFDQYDRASIKDRNGVHNVVMEGVDVKDLATMRSVPADGKTIGEVMLRSNTMMLGYLKNVQGTQAAFKNGWYGTRDLGVRDPDGHIRIKDRAANAIFNCGGNAISTLEIEAVLASHPAVEATAVVGRPDKRLGESPCAFVKLKEGRTTSSQDIIEFCGVRLPNYMVPESVIFGDLPENSTGKILKFVLKEKAKDLGSLCHSNGHLVV
ncbi:butanoate--CoA ligase AAE1-like isoform X1 [Rhododendron vialii]|uniref:butanoate--CoA ligase AAE1-like isoform X1 n=1 Tax=Rhododendron vialii TaxID=182163 RepID=UPI00265D7E35|nr:butanoate--CoA ligase AAE1-like isoform X1 [Rhododendron vialii]XP_058187056.1 butanoate--CoA ligase AAE1-like isoform X1 [Rhododendron vialii]